MTHHSLSHPYRLNGQLQVWQREDFASISYSDGDVIEERIASLLQQAQDVSVLSPELAGHCTDWPSLYHLSSSRANILRPFENELAKAEILEIGSGCGAITRYLGETGATVLALEGSLRRAGITRARCRELDNVTVLAEKFERFETQARFDVVTLIGVAEYAPVFSPGPDPVLSILEKARSLLKPEGTLIMAIENRLGLKYFAGAPEDHIGCPMYGIEGRYKTGEPCTPGLIELRERLHLAGFGAIGFMAPFPDYKFATSIVTEQGFDCPGFDPAALITQAVRMDPQLPQVLAFSPEKVWPALVKNGIALEMSNSFLVRAAASAPPLPADRQILAWHYSTRRAPCFCKQTVFTLHKPEGTISVTPSAISTTPSPRQEGRMIQWTLPSPTSYISARLLSEAIRETISNDGWKIADLAPHYRQYRDILSKASGIHGAPASLDSLSDKLPGALYDLIPQNILIDDNGQYHIFDQEWCLTAPIEFGWLMIRSMLYIMQSVVRVGACADTKTATPADLLMAACKALDMPLSREALEEYVNRELTVQREISGRHDSLVQPVSAILDTELSQRNIWQTVGLQQEQITALQETIAQNAANAAEVADLRNQIAALQRSLSRRLPYEPKVLPLVIRGVTAFHKYGFIPVIRDIARRIRRSGLRTFFKEVSDGPVAEHPPSDRHDYQSWIRRYDTLDKTFQKKRRKIRSSIAAFPAKPAMSIITHCPDGWSPDDLEAMARTAVSQLYRHWELLVIDKPEADAALRQRIRKATGGDVRIRFIHDAGSADACSAINDAITHAAGEWIILLEPGTVLAEHALYCIAGTAVSSPGTALIYSDDDRIDALGIRHSPSFKPEWDEVMFRSGQLRMPLCALHKPALIALGGLRTAYTPAAQFDLILRLMEQTAADAFRHIPRILCHRLETPAQNDIAYCRETALDKGAEALRDHLKRTGADASVAVFNGGLRIRYSLPSPPPRVSIIIPVRNGLSLFRTCIRSILGKSTYPDFEVIVVDNGSDDPAMLEYLEDLEKDPRLRIIRDPRPFNYSALNNRAVATATGEMIALVNSDIEVITPDWLEEMAALAAQPRAGAVGACLWYPDDTLQHGGVIVGMGGVAGHVPRCIARANAASASAVFCLRSATAVTAACLVVRRDLYESVGGLNETLAVAFNDTDFCLKLHSKGYRNLWTPYAELYHHESASRGTENTPEKQRRFAGEIAYMQREWRQAMAKDSAYNPNLTLETEDLSLAWPPRVSPLV